jgi:ATP-dependent protease ClpP protease subunit
MNLDLYGEIGWNVLASDVRNQLKKAEPNEQLNVSISSPGGLVFEAIEIFNSLKDHAGKVVVDIKGMAASAAGYIAMAGDEIRVRDNSVFMAHNPWVLAIGDYKEFSEQSDFLNRLTQTISSAFERSGKTNDEVRTMLDDTTWLFGKEIIDEGFADKMIDSEVKASVTNDEYMNSAKKQVDCLLEKMRTEPEALKKDMLKASALLPALENNVEEIENQTQKPATAEKTEVIKMTLDELMKNHKDVFDAAFNMGVKKERKRVRSHMNMLSKNIGKEFAEKAIREGDVFDDEAQSYYLSETMNARDLASREEDNPEQVQTPVEAATNVYETEAFDSLIDKYSEVNHK